MSTVCIQCALRAVLDGKPTPTFEESAEEHMRRCHPDPIVTQRERRELEQCLAERMKSEKAEEKDSA